MPLKRNFLQSFFFEVLMAMKTVPTGLLGVPPVGPATPVMDMAKSVLAILRTSCAIFIATAGETAPCLAIRLAGIPSILIFA